MRTSIFFPPAASQFRRIDFLAAVFLGEGIACLGLVTFRAVEIGWPEGLSPTQERIFLGIALPLLAVIGIRLAAAMSRWVPWLLQAAKFCIVGLFNTTIDFAVLNLLIAYLDATQGVAYSFCKAISFGVAVVNSYGWNRLWTFAQGMGFKPGAGKIVTHEFPRFLAVTLVGVTLNATVASLIVTIVSPSGSLAAVRWANLAAAAALVVSATWDFLAYRYIVFTHAIPSDRRHPSLWPRPASLISTVLWPVRKGSQFGGEK